MRHNKILNFVDRRNIFLKKLDINCNKAVEIQDFSDKKWFIVRFPYARQSTIVTKNDNIDNPYRYDNYHCKAWFNPLTDKIVRIDGLVIFVSNCKYYFASTVAVFTANKQYKKLPSDFKRKIMEFNDPYAKQKAAALKKIA